MKTEKMYAVAITRHCYGPSTERTLLQADDGRGYYREFAAMADARATIAELERGDYVLSNNESGSPEYTVVTVGSRRFLRHAS